MPLDTEYIITDTARGLQHITSGQRGQSDPRGQRTATVPGIITTAEEAKRLERPPLPLNQGYSAAGKFPANICFSQVAQGILIQTNVFDIDTIISGGAIHLHQNTLQCAEEEVFLQINNLNEPASIFWRNVYISKAGRWL